MRRSLSPEVKMKLAENGLQKYRDFLDHIDYIQERGFGIYQFSDVLGCHRNTIYNVINSSKNRTFPQYIIYFFMVEGIYEYASKHTRTPKRRKNDIRGANVRVVKGGDYEDSKKK